MIQPTSTVSTELQRQCSDAALHCYGTGYIFEKRAINIRKNTRLITFLGIAGPAAVGAIISTIGSKSNMADAIIAIAGIIAVIQLVISIWSLVAGWDNSLSYATESKSDNYRLSEEFIKLRNNQEVTLMDFKSEFRILEKLEASRRNADDRADITDKEKRMGMRSALRKFMRPCAHCEITPDSLTPTACNVCGNF